MGRGIPRIINKCNESSVDVDFYNDVEKLEFKVVFKRPVG